MKRTSEFVVISFSTVFWVVLAVITILVWAPWPTSRRDEHDEARLD